jgi:ribosomal protein S18 acetylase RimI-like enzyme
MDGRLELFTAASHSFLGDLQGAAEAGRTAASGLLNSEAVLLLPTLGLGATILGGYVSGAMGVDEPNPQEAHPAATGPVPQRIQPMIDRLRGVVPTVAEQAAVARWPPYRLLYNRIVGRASPLDVLPVDRKDAARAGAVLGRAFFDTEQWSKALPDSSVRQRKLEQMFAGTVKLTYAAGGLAERTPGFEAVALWLPPGRTIGFWAVLKSGFASARFAITPPYPNLRRLTAMLREFEESHKQTMPDPHWYLMALGVDPEHQRRGHGGTLVRNGIQRADDDAMPIYLETETDANVTFYETLGFEVLDEVTIEAIDLPFSLMLRRPNAGPV